eukprot:maker-scaffold17_size721972-snap-gene-1.23 protein:Tk09958 transcript:maker-scaffold17_size721972-snap-gene-1.23-mRNA-1 annotation:"hypothetical protein LOTGIDRAFT_222617"
MARFPSISAPSESSDAAESATDQNVTEEHQEPEETECRPHRFINEPLYDPQEILRKNYDLEVFLHRRLLKTHMGRNSRFVFSQGQGIISYDSWIRRLVFYNRTVPMSPYRLQQLVQRTCYLDWTMNYEQYDASAAISTGINPLFYMEAIYLARSCAAQEAPISRDLDARYLMICAPSPVWRGKMRNPIEEAEPWSKARQKKEFELVEFESTMPTFKDLDRDQRESLKSIIHTHPRHTDWLTPLVDSIAYKEIKCRCIRKYGERGCKCVNVFQTTLFTLKLMLARFPHYLLELPLYFYRINVVILNERAKLEVMAPGIHVCYKCLLPIKRGFYCPCLGLRDVICKLFKNKFLGQFLSSYTTTELPQYVDTITAEQAVAKSKVITIEAHLMHEAMELIKNFSLLTGVAGPRMPFCEDNVAPKITRPYSSVVTLRNIVSMILPVVTGLDVLVCIDEGALLSIRSNYNMKKIQGMISRLHDAVLELEKAHQLAAMIGNRWDVMEIFTNFHRILFHPWLEMDMSAEETLDMYQFAFQLRNKKLNVMSYAIDHLKSTLVTMSWRLDLMECDLSLITTDSKECYNDIDHAPPDFPDRILEQIMCIHTFVSDLLVQYNEITSKLVLVRSGIEEKELIDDNLFEVIDEILEYYENCTFCGDKVVKKICSICKAARSCGQPRCQDVMNGTHKLVCHQRQEDVIKGFCTLHFNDLAELFYGEHPVKEELRLVPAVKMFHPIYAGTYQTWMYEGKRRAYHRELWDARKFLQNMEETSRINDEMLRKCLQEKMLPDSVKFDPVQRIDRCSMPV